ncbi:MAG: DNA gyrase/topoisomerase IV subunit A, partial [Bacteroidia bacterium]
YAYLYERFKPFRKKLLRDIIDEDLARLTQIPMIRITRFDSIKADEKMKELDERIGVVKHHLEHLIDYAIEYFKELKKKYGAGRERKTEIRQFDVIEKSQVALSNVKLHVNREEGFIGFGLKKDEFAFECSDLDEIIVFRSDGVMMVTKVAEKTYVGKDIIHLAIFKKGDERTTYHLVYRDGKQGNVMVKRFNVTGVTRDKEYNLTRGAKDSKVHYFSVCPNGEDEIISVLLTKNSGARKLEFDMDLRTVPVKGRDAQGNILTRYPVQKITLKAKSKGEVQKQVVYFDDKSHRLTYEKRGKRLGEFSPEDKILEVTGNGNYRLTGFDLSTYFDDDIVLIEKFDPKAICTTIYVDGESKQHFVKRFVFEPTEKKTVFITEHDQSRIEAISTSSDAIVTISYAKVKGEERKDDKLKAESIIELRNIKAKGNKLSPYKVKSVEVIDPFAKVSEEEIEEEVTGLSPLEQLRQDKSDKKDKGGLPQMELF